MKKLARAYSQQFVRVSLYVLSRVFSQLLVLKFERIPYRTEAPDAIITIYLVTIIVLCNIHIAYRIHSECCLQRIPSFRMLTFFFQNADFQNGNNEQSESVSNK